MEPQNLLGGYVTTVALVRPFFVVQSSSFFLSLLLTSQLPNKVNTGGEESFADGFLHGMNIIWTKEVCKVTGKDVYELGDISKFLDGQAKAQVLQVWDNTFRGRGRLLALNSVRGMC